ncbi:MAG: hypothetical protein LBQ93_01215 [Treponema sp.]|jgi:UDP-N-acetylmuramyl pentapeptide phosphotransferase/UDP-N-acetylglucosamine-1-phosphate transferase|nr:hypothetical protein [Treponema sp.]
MQKTYKTVNSVESLAAAVKRIRTAQQAYAAYTQEHVDAVFRAAAMQFTNCCFLWYNQSTDF